MHLSDLQDEKGKIKPRLVNVDSEFAQLCFQNLHYINENDYLEAKKYVKFPSEYDFKKILIEK